MKDMPSDETIEAHLTADLAAEDCGQPTEKLTPEQGIAAMQARLDYLIRHPEMSTQRIALDTQRRLNDYKLLLRSNN